MLEKNVYSISKTSTDNRGVLQYVDYKPENRNPIFIPAVVNLFPMSPEDRPELHTILEWNSRSPITRQDLNCSYMSPAYGAQTPEL